MRRKVLKLSSLCDYVSQSLVLSSQSWSSDDDYLFGFPAWGLWPPTHPLSLSSHTHAPHTGHPLIHLVMRMRIVNIFVHDDDSWLKVLIMPVWLNAPTLESRSGLADDITQTFLTHVISLSADTSKHPHTQTSSDFQPAFIDDAPQNFSHYVIVSVLNIWTSAQRWSLIILWLNSIN